MACEDSVIESIIVSDINNNLITLNNGDTLLARTNNVADLVLSISTASGALDITIAPQGVLSPLATPTAPYAILYNGTNVIWNKLISTDANNTLVTGTDGGLFVSIAGLSLDPILQLSSGPDASTVDDGPFDIDYTDRLHFWSDGSIAFDVNAAAGVATVQATVELSGAVGNIITQTGSGLYAAASETTTTFTNPSPGVYRYTNEIGAVAQLNLNASSLIAIDTNDILGGGAGASTFVQSLLDALSTASLTETLTSLGYNSSINRLTYTDENGSNTVIDLTSGSSTEIQGTNASVIQTKVTGVGSVPNPYTIEAIFKGKMNDLLDVGITSYIPNYYLKWTGTKFDLGCIASSSCKF
jgi:hypothetical protein